MRASFYRSYGAPLEMGDLPRPSAGPGQLLVQVAFSSVNPIDWKMSTGGMRLLIPVQFPAVPGFDVSGTVVEVGSGASGFAVGDLVHARVDGGAGATCAEFVAADASLVVKVPEGMGLAEAAALPLAGLTALQGLRDQALLPMTGARERVLVVGASGGVGHLALQIAKASGALVSAVCSGRNAALATSLGADEVIDYTLADPWTLKGPWDVILDCVGDDPAPWTPRLAGGGRYVSTLPGPRVLLRQALNPFNSKKVRAVLVKSKAADLAVLDGLFSAGKLKIVADERFALDELPKAWERSKSGRTVGKIVVQVAGG